MTLSVFIFRFAKSVAKDPTMIRQGRVHVANEWKVGIGGWGTRQIKIQDVSWFPWRKYDGEHRGIVECEGFFNYYFRKVPDTAGLAEKKRHSMPTKNCDSKSTRGPKDGQGDDKIYSKVV